MPLPDVPASAVEPHFQTLAQKSPPRSDTSKLPKKTIDDIVMAMLFLPYAPYREDSDARRIADAWPDIWRWVQVMFVQFVDQRHYEPPSRGYLPALAMIGFCCISPISADAVRRTPNILSVLARYWLRHDEIVADLLQEGVVYACPTYPFHTILDHRTSDKPFGELLDAAGGSHDRVARTMLGHLKYIIAREPPPVVLVRGKLVETCTLSWKAPLFFHTAFLSAGGLTTIIDTLMMLNAQPRASEEVIVCTHMCFESLTEGVRAPNAGVWAARALDAGLLPAVLGAAGTIKRMDAEDAKFCYAFLSEHAPPLLIYHFVVRAVMKALAKPELQKHVRQLKKGSMRCSWAKFFGCAYERIIEKARMEAEVKAKGGSFCDNTECKEVDSSKLKQCTGCGMVMYCSKECQLFAWSSHKPYCNTVKKNLSRGESFELTGRDHLFATWLIQRDIYARDAELAKQWKDKFPREPRSALAVLLDLSKTPPKATVMRTRDIRDARMAAAMRKGAAEGLDAWNVTASLGDWSSNDGVILLALLIPAGKTPSEVQGFDLSQLPSELEEVKKATEGHKQ